MGEAAFTPIAGPSEAYVRQLEQTVEGLKKELAGAYVKFYPPEIDLFWPVRIFILFIFCYYYYYFS